MKEFIRAFIVALPVAMGSSLAWGSPYTAPPGAMKVEASVSVGKSDKIVLADDKSMGVGLNHLAIITKGTYGVCTDWDASARLDIRRTTGTQSYTGVSAIELASKYRFVAAGGFSSALELGTAVPLGYDAQSLAAPGKGEVAMKGTLKAAFYDPGAFPLYVGFDFGRDQYLGDVPAQHRWLASLYWFHGVYSAGGFYGGAESQDGKNLGSGAGQTTKYAEVQEEYTTYGLSGGMQLDAATSINLAISIKPEAGLKNSDANTSYVLTVGKSL